MCDCDGMCDDEWVTEPDDEVPEANQSLEQQVMQWLAEADAQETFESHQLEYWVSLFGDNNPVSATDEPTSHTPAPENKQTESP